MPPPYHCGFNVYGAPGVSINAEINRAAIMHADTVRIVVKWDQIQHDGPTSWNWSEVENIRQMIIWARQWNPNLKVLPVFDGVPPWCTSPSWNGRYVTSLSEISSYGYAASATLLYLGDCADFIELANEPNQKHSKNSSASEMASTYYGAMAAYTIYWVDYCHGATKQVLVGSMAVGSSIATDYVEDGGWQGWMVSVMAYVSGWLTYIYSGNPTKAAALNQGYRISFHPYPHTGQADAFSPYPASPNNRTGDRNALDASSTVFDQVNAVAAYSGGRRLWLTETGVSEWKIGADATSGQARFVTSLDQNARLRQLEGVLWFPLNDGDPEANDMNRDKCRFGVVWADNNSYKPAAGTITSLWA